MSGANGGGPIRPAAIEGGLGSCWFCGRPVSPRALFCHKCGSLQPPRDLDAFTRLGVARRFDLDPAELDRQTLGFLRVLDADRFESRGPRERALAEQHRSALTAARAQLKDPLRRAQLLLELEQVQVPELPLADPWSPRLAAADGDAAALDALAHELGREEAAELRGLAAAFRIRDFTTAAERVARLRLLAAPAREVRRLRPPQAPPVGHS